MSDIHDEIADCEQAIWEKGARKLMIADDGGDYFEEPRKKMNKYIVVADPNDKNLGAYATQRIVHNTLDAALAAAKSMSKKNRAAYFVAKLTHKVELVDVAVTELEDRD